jgi:trimeric autotransporter adhesin
MKKLTYLFVFLIVASSISCEKKIASPTPIPQNQAPVTKDTVSGKIYTFAGNGHMASYALGGDSGDGGHATKAELWAPAGIVADAAGNIYIADQQSCRIRKVDTKGIISTYAGIAYGGYSGDGGQATAAEMHFPYGLAMDGSGNLYIADNGNYCVRKVNASGIILTYAGNGIDGWSGDGGPATSAEIYLPKGLAVDISGNLYIADGNSYIRKVNTSGIISSIAGTGVRGYSGDGGPATAAELDEPQGVTIDGSGNIYIADYTNDRIRMISTNGIITTIAGNGFGASPVAGDGGYSGDGGPATSAELYNPTDVKVDASGNVYFADADNYRIRMVNTSGIISTIVGNGQIYYSGDGGPPTVAEIGFIQSIGFDNLGNLYLPDLYFNRVRIVYK